MANFRWPTLARGSMGEEGVMGIRGDLQGISESAKGNHDQVANDFMEWLTCADTLTYLGRFMDGDDISAYCLAVGHLKAKVL